MAAVHVLVCVSWGNGRWKGRGRRDVPGEQRGTGFGLRWDVERECLVWPGDVRVERDVARTAAVVGVEYVEGEAVVEGDGRLAAAAAVRCEGAFTGCDMAEDPT